MSPDTIFVIESKLKTEKGAKWLATSGHSIYYHPDIALIARDALNKATDVADFRVAEYKRRRAVRS